MRKINRVLCYLFSVLVLSITVFGKTTAKAEDFSDMLGEQPDGTYGGMGGEPGEEYEVPGHWELTDILYFNPEVKELTGEELTLSVSRPEENPEDFVFSYADASGNAVISYSIDTDPFKEKYYPLKKDAGFSAEDLLWETMYAYREPDNEALAMDIRITYALADMEIYEDEGAYSLDNISYFERENIQFDAYPINEDYNARKRRIQSYNITNEFAAGQTDGQVRYIVVEVWDPSFEGSRMTNAYKYTWVEQIETFSTEPIYGPIEYTPVDEPGAVTETGGATEQDMIDPPVPDNPPVESYSDSTSGETIAVLLLFILVPVIVIAGIIVIIVKAVKKGKKG